MTVRKLTGLILAATMMMCLSACGQVSSDSQAQNGQEQQEQYEHEVEYVTVVLPRSIAGEVTPENIDSFKEYYGLQDAVINADGSVTEIMTKERWLTTLALIRIQTDDGLEALAGSEQYPDITGAEVNSTYDAFTIYIGSDGIGDSEMALCSRLGGYAYYHAVFLGTASPFTFTVEFRDSESGDLIYRYTQDDWQDPNE